MQPLFSKYSSIKHAFIAAAMGLTAMTTAPSVHSAGVGWSIVPYFGFSQLGDQSASLVNAENIAPGNFNVAVDSGFTAGLSVRYDYKESPWTSEFGWEYRSNDSTITTADGSDLPSGNYASNVFYLNGRYQFNGTSRLTPWVGGGLTLIQEIDLDSENAAGERSFSDGGAVGFQVMAGIDYDLSERFYLTSELRYSSQAGLDLTEEGGAGKVSDIDYQPLTLGLGIGYRF